MTYENMRSKVVALLPQSASIRTTRHRHRVKQGVNRVPLKFKFVMPDGQVLDEKDLSPEQKQAAAQKIMDVLLIPMAYEAVLDDVQKERELAAID